MAFCVARAPKPVALVNGGALVLICVLVQGGVAAAAGERVHFATVNGQLITLAELDYFVRQRARQQLYHQRLDGEKIADLRQRWGTALIERYLVAGAAREMNLHPDEQRIKTVLAALRKQGRLSSTELEFERRRLIQDDLFEQFRSRVSESLRLTQDEIEAYYRTHPDKFTTPEQFNVSLILLRVPPYSSSADWREAQREAQRLRERLVNGEDFAMIANAVSDHESARQGGHLGVIHAGMLNPQVESVVKGMQEGEISSPILTLQGIVLVKLHERLEPKLNRLAQVKARVETLLREEKARQLWQQTLEQLRTSAEIHIN